MSYRVHFVRFEDGLVRVSDLYGVTNTQRQFLNADIIKSEPVIKVINVKGWNFKKIFLIEGTEENGRGWAFVKK